MCLILQPNTFYVTSINKNHGYFSEDLNSDLRLMKGETVLVIGASPKRGHLLVEYVSQQFHVPFQYMELKPGTAPGYADI